MTPNLVLIIEDNELNLKLFRDVLLSRDYDVIEAITAEDGLEMAHDRIPSLVLMDIQLPGMNGIEALGKLRADPVTREIPVMAVTASVMPLERDEILAAGFDGYQPKPISLKDFVAEVRRVLDLSLGSSAESSTDSVP